MSCAFWFSFDVGTLEGKIVRLYSCSSKDLWASFLDKLVMLHTKEKQNIVLHLWYIIAEADLWVFFFEMHLQLDFHLPCYGDFV